MNPVKGTPPPTAAPLLQTGGGQAADALQQKFK